MVDVGEVTVHVVNLEDVVVVVLVGCVVDGVVDAVIAVTDDVTVVFDSDTLEVAFDL